MRGVPRERDAISLVPSGVAGHVEEPGRPVHDLVELVGVVELEVGR